ncbi:MAG: hypothetical protein ACJ72W_17935 [Actinoallomurus sp.]
MTLLAVGHGTRDPAGVAVIRRRIAVASYLLAPGHFHDRLLAAGADLVAPPPGVQDAPARFIRHRGAPGAAAATSRDRRVASRAG